eukprot:Skav232525  [mRNA]  locus=C9321943:41:3088:- [translate_table: standard]
MTSFSPGECVESLLYGEQILMGPTSRIERYHDRYANDLPSDQPLDSISVLVIHWEDTHNQVRIVLCQTGMRKEIWVERGTRIFQIVTPQQGKMVVRENGIATPWDFPLHGPTTLQIIDQEESDHDDEEIPPTVPFLVTEANTNSQDLNRTTRNMSITRVVMETNENIKQVTSATKRVTPRSVDPWETSCRYQQMWEFGAAMADDECSYILQILEEPTHRCIRGIVSWDHVQAEWSIHPQWREECTMNNDGNTALMMMYDSHWIPTIIYAQPHKMVYRCQYDLPLPVLQQMGQMIGVTINSFIREPCNDPHGWCGWGAVAWLFNHFSLNPPNMDRSEGQDEEKVFATMLGPLKYREYVGKIQTKNCLFQSMLGMRMMFIKHLAHWPSQFTHVGYGPDEAQQNLKLQGKLASILIAHGHPDSEALKVAKQIAQTCPKLARGIPSQRDSKSYGSLLQLCSEQGIELQATGTNGAIQKLQRFFRAKQSKKSKNQGVIDLSQITFHENTFGYQGKGTAPQPQWATTTVGLAIAQTDDILPYVAEDKCLSQDCNTAIINKWIPVGKTLSIEQVEVPVMDKDMNHAVIRVWLVHFGARKIQKMPAVGSTVTIDTDETCVISMQVHKHLSDVQLWKSLQESPAKTILQHYFKPGDAPPIIELWSRRWTKSNKTVQHAEADMFSMLCRIDAKHTDAFLKKSGTGVHPIFSSIKPENNSDDRTKFRIVWVSKEIHSALVKLAMIPDHHGLVHRVPTSFGIRVACSRFESAWREVRGEEPLPSNIECKHRYLLAGAPPGMPGPKVEEWAKGIDWKIRVLRNYGGGRYLVGSTDEVPSQNLAIQSHTIICQPFAEKAPRQESSVVLGKLNLAQVENAKGGEDSLLLNDPWAKPSGFARDVATTSAPWARYKPTTTNNQQMQVDDGSSPNDALAAQSIRMTEMETQIKNIQEQMSADQRATQAKFQQVDHSIQAMSSSLKHTLDNALSQQSASLVQTFEALLKRSPRTESSKESGKERSRSPAKRGDK